MNDFQRKALLVLILLMLVFIWGNSLLPGGQSDGMSKGLLFRLEKLLHFSGDFERLNHLLRKLAHFSEYMVYGVLMCLYFLRDPDVRFVPLSLCAATAVCDETIQIFSGRGPSVFDVLIDVSGSALGVALILLIFSLAKKRPLKKI